MDGVQGNKRLKTASGASGGEDGGDGARIGPLESENRALRSEVTHLRSEKALPWEQLQRLQGSHDVLPVVASTPTVNLSRLSESLVTQIASFVGASRELLNLALTCKSFGWQQPDSSRNWSLAEDVARQAVSSGLNDIKGVRTTLPQYARGAATWLSILHESETPLKFDKLLGRGVEHHEKRSSVRATDSASGTTAASNYVMDDGTFTGTAFASNYVMDSGIHYAEFQIAAGHPWIGIVRPLPNLDPDRYSYDGYFTFFYRPLYDDFLAERTDEWGSGNVHVCQYNSMSGRMSWTNWDGQGEYMAEWDGIEGCETATDHTIGMLLNLNEGMDGHPPQQSSDDTPPPDDRLDEDAPAATDASSTSRTAPRRGRRKGWRKDKGKDTSSTRDPPRRSKRMSRGAGGRSAESTGFTRFHAAFLATRTSEWGSGNVHACQYHSLTGRMGWTNWEAGPSELEDWEGIESCMNGGTIGMRLDLNEGTLAVYKNNHRLGVMKEGLSRSYCWCATIVGHGCWPLDELHGCTLAEKSASEATTPSMFVFGSAAKADADSGGGGGGGREKASSTTDDAPSFTFDVSSLPAVTATPTANGDNAPAAAEGFKFNVRPFQPAAAAVEGGDTIPLFGIPFKSRQEIRAGVKTQTKPEEKIGLPTTMNDDHGNKSLQTDVRNDELESENRALRSEVTRLRSENALLREQLLQLQGGHDVMPVVVPAPTPIVNLSRLDPSLVTQIASFVLTSRELFNLALTCKSFGWQQPDASPNLSLAEEVAQLAVRSGQNDIEGVRITLPHYARGKTTWLSILSEYENPLKFDTLLGRGIEHSSNDRTSVHRTDSFYSTAVARIYVMDSGIHYSEFHITGGNPPRISIVRPLPNLDPARYADGHFSFFRKKFYADFLAERTGEWGSGNVHACQYNSLTGRMSWTNWDREGGGEVPWGGMEYCSTGDTIGMRLDLNEGTLTVYINNRRLGVMKDGLSGSYCWCASILAEGSIAINRGAPPMANLETN
ncbi:hypothetical protein THAOC_04425 [Thalassiosira oceanica]|uniref:B30.2/SPRY domain-containing protein n=1 Tax=Thalassiosira oceanica TaxID=159749 RepID=K0T9Z3_THAOC|nr:hypothetical protein THAOC_04425 [Thalassiosira oceanica]|eukprot:EJK73929.1 hypothetical protein THAOC_04425 [Thalassiosira oceanica]